MRRMIGGLVALGVLVLPSAALAAQYSGDINQTPGTVDFKIAKVDGKRTVTRFDAMSIPMTCEGGDSVYGFGANASAVLKPDRSFVANIDLGGGPIRVTGEMGAGFDDGKGTLRAQAETMTLGHCHSAKLRWKAERDR